MQQLQHKRFTVRNDQQSLPISYSYVQLCPGFVAIGNVNNKDRIRPWFKRYEA